MKKITKILVGVIVGLTLISLPSIAIAEPEAIEETLLEKTVIEQYFGYTVFIPNSNSLAYRNNNPGNLRYAGQIGAVRGHGGFAYFESPESGFSALINQIKLDMSRGLTLDEFIHKFAPPSENHTHEYISQAVASLGFSKDEKISRIPMKDISSFMAKKESSTVVEFY